MNRENKEARSLLRAFFLVELCADGQQGLPAAAAFATVTAAIATVTTVAATATAAAAATTAPATAVAATATAAAATTAPAAAATATAAATTTAAPAAATTAAAATTTTLFAGLGFVHGEVTTFKGLAVHAGDSGFAARAILELNEAEAAGAAGFAVHHQDGTDDFTELLERLTQGVFGDAERQITNVELHALHSQNARNLTNA
jgi:hypothetical protein